MKIKSIALTVLMSLFLLAACGGGNNNGSSSLSVYDGADFTININPNWRIITESDFYSEIPKETVVAFTLPEAFDGFFANVNVVKEKLNQAVSSIDYGRANINLSAQNLTDYEKVQEATIEIGNENALVHIFQARLNPTEKMLRFVQLYLTKEETGYIITGGMLPTTPKEIRDEIGNSVTSFRLK